VSGGRVWRLVRAGIVGSAVIGAALVVFGHADLLGTGRALLHASPGWLLVAVVLQCVSLAAYVSLQRWLLTAGGATIRLRTLWSTVVLADAIASTVPLAGNAAGIAFSYREFRRAHLPATTAATTPLLVAGVSVVTFVDLAALGGVLSRETVPAGAGLLALVATGAVVACWSSRGRSSAASGCPVDASGRRAAPRRRAARLVRDVAAAFTRLDPRALGHAFLLGSSRWLADALSLAAAVAATGASVPWDHILLAWAAGAAVTTLGVTPNGVGTADAALVGVLAAAGLSPAAAVAASVLYRVVLLKPLPRIGWLLYRQRRLSASTG